MFIAYLIIASQLRPALADEPVKKSGVVWLIEQDMKDPMPVEPEPTPEPSDDMTAKPAPEGEPLGDEPAEVILPEE